MPILLNNLQASVQNVAKTYSPKFFDEKLTGRGGNSAGLLSDKNSPLGVNPTLTTRPSDKETRRRTYRSGQTTTIKIPLSAIELTAMDYLDRIQRPELNDMVPIAAYTDKRTNQLIELYLHMQAHNITIEETTTADKYGQQTGTKRDFRCCYHVRIFELYNQNDTTHIRNSVHTFGDVASVSNNILPPTTYNTNVSTKAAGQSQQRYWSLFTVNPLQELIFDMMPALKAHGWTTQTHLLQDYLNSFDIYAAVCAKSEEWQTSIDKQLEAFFDNLTNPANNRTKDERLNAAITEVKYIMSYNIPLDLYKNIYAAITKNFSADDVRNICKQNLNLLLSNTLGNLDANKSQIPGFAPQASNAPLPASVQRLSPEQMKAVQSNEPLILVQAGAGTGKSTLILGRIDYLTHAGVKSEDITVLSFTNAAADNIIAKNANVHSMTIARMIHEIYTANFTNHELSTLDTIANSIDIYYPPKAGVSRGVVDQFQKRIAATIKKEPNNFTEMNNFIEENYDAVIDILDTIGQTTLELEIIICYQKIDTFIEPPTIASKYLIIDEVQDNSVFEFVYTLRYVDKHKESLFIVGDCSQTLYEFRASNPRALNILEGSGTFATYQLNVNYRSNQEILDFANIALQNIEANQYARIQLQANSLAAVTEQSFIDRVHFNYHQLSKLSDFHQELPGIFSMEIKPYIDDCLSRQESVAVLAFTRQDIAVIKQILTDQYPGKTIISLVPEKMYNTTVMTTFIKKYWHDIKFAPYSKLVNTIVHEIMAKLPFIVYNDQKAAPRIQQMLWDWATKNTPCIQAWVHQFQQGQLSETQMLDLVKDNMIKYEINTNAIKQALLSLQNQQVKTNNASADADFVLSTIHSAKGLEFDNVIVLYRNENQMDEDKKRMYYVALTRAMKSEYILAYDTMASPQIQADYLTVLSHLHAVAPAVNSPIDQFQAKGKRGRHPHIKI